MICTLMAFLVPLHVIFVADAERWELDVKKQDQRSSTKSGVALPDIVGSHQKDDESMNILLQAKIFSGARNVVLDEGDNNNDNMLSVQDNQKEVSIPTQTQVDVVKKGHALADVGNRKNTDEENDKKKGKDGYSNNKNQKVYWSKHSCWTTPRCWVYTAASLEFREEKDKKKEDKTTWGWPLISKNLKKDTWAWPSISKLKAAKQDERKQYLAHLECDRVETLKQVSAGLWKTWKETDDALAGIAKTKTKPDVEPTRKGCYNYMTTFMNGVKEAFTKKNMDLYLDFEDDLLEEKWKKAQKKTDEWKEVFNLVRTRVDAAEYFIYMPKSSAGDWCRAEKAVGKEKKVVPIKWDDFYDLMVANYKGDDKDFVMGQSVGEALASQVTKASSEKDIKKDIHDQQICGEMEATYEDLYGQGLSFEVGKEDSYPVGAVN